MPDYTLTGPDGKSYRLKTPEGTTREQAMAVATRHLRDLIAPETPKTAVVGGAFNMPATGKAPDHVSMGFEKAQQPQQDAEAIHTRLNELRAAGRTKGDPEFEKLARQQAAEMDKRHAGATSLMGGIGAAPEGIGGALLNTAKRIFVKAAPTEAAALARKAGYVLRPQNIAPESTQATKIASALPGKIKMQQLASSKNEAVTEGLVRKALGLPEGAPLTRKTLNAVRADAAKAKNAIIQQLPEVVADKVSYAEVQGIIGTNSHAAQMFPEIMKNTDIKQMVGSLMRQKRAPTDVALKVVQKLREDANANLRAVGDTGKHALGLAQRQAADAIDDLIERNLAARMGGNRLVADYRAARQLMAKTYDVQAVTNQVGEVNAMGLARLAEKGRPLTGELDTIAQVAANFPKEVQMPSKFGGVEDYSVLDFFGGGGAAMTGHPGVATMFLARPFARAGMLSGPMQDLLASGPASGAGVGTMTPAVGAALLQGRRQ